MGVQKLINQNVRKITKLGGKSLAITLPKELVVELGWKEKQKVKVTRVRGGLLIKDWKK
jgi:antitoxin component of MazEF toxin-antitoxin module